MAGSVIDAFSLIGELSEEPAFSDRLRIRVDEVLHDKEDHKDARLATIFMEGEQGLIRRKPSIRVEDLRRQAATRLSGLGSEFLGFRSLFLSDEPQLLDAASALIRDYAENSRRFFGPKLISRIVDASLKETPWKGLEIDLKTGITYSQKTMRSLAECADLVTALLSGWFQRMKGLIGASASRRLFELAFSETEKTHGFLPMTNTLLSLTPSGVLMEEKARRLYELESQTMKQARSIRTADQSLSVQSSQLQKTVNELQEARRQLEVVNAAKSEFIEVVAHQFRTPLSSIRWNGELLTEAVSEKAIDAQYADLIETVRSKSVYLIETLDRVFATLDIETGKLVIDEKPAFLWEVVQDVYNMYQKEIGRRGLKWKFHREKEQLKEIPMDKAKITTVLKILIGNAINYSSDGGSLAVSLGDRTINGNEYQVFTIKDSGIGIPKEEADKVFEKFYRAQPAKLKSPDGTGLGMFIIKNLVEAHRGMVKLASEGTGKGTTISFALPVR